MPLPLRLPRSAGTGPGAAGQRDLLPLVRRVLLLAFFAALATAALVWLVAPAVPHARSWPVAVAVWALAGSAWQRAWRGRTHLVDDVVAATALTGLVWAAGTAAAGAVLTMGVAHRALYGRAPGAVAVVVLQLAGLCAGTLLAGGPLAEADLLGTAPGVVVTAGAFHLLARTLRRYETGARARFEALVRASSDAILVIDAGSRVTYASPALPQVVGRAVPGGSAQLLLDWVVPGDRDHLRERIAALLAGEQSSTTLTCRVTDDAGGVRHVEVVVRDARDTPHVEGLIVNAHDVTARVELAAQLRHQALHDPLTGLANRVLFGDRLTQALARRDGAVAVVAVDLDGFKAVNDTLGHASGDALLVAVGRRMRERVRPEDTVARLGGDEFAVLLTGGGVDEAFVRQVGDRLRAAVADAVLDAASAAGPDAAPDAVGARTTAPAVSASLGAVVDDGTGTGDDLLRRADLALYEAKGAGRDRLEVYRPGLHDGALARLGLEADLRGAVQRGELVLHYQPIYQLGPGHLVGVEALVRWQHPERGLVPPADFVPVAEDTGLIHPIGAWVLHEACRAVAAWQGQRARTAPGPDRSGAPAPLGVSVNLSVRQLQDPGITGVVAGALRASGLAPGTLTVEITESVLVTDPLDVLARLQEIRALGVRVAVDDFGTGYSALSYLQRFPVDEVKIDRSFVERLGGDDPDAAALATAIIAMGSALQLGTVAEGIETAAQQAELTVLGCHLGQGFGLARPMDEEALGALLAAGDAGPGSDVPGRARSVTL